MIEAFLGCLLALALMFAGFYTWLAHRMMPRLRETMLSGAQVIGGLQQLSRELTIEQVETIARVLTPAQLKLLRNVLDRANGSNPDAPTGRPSS